MFVLLVVITVVDAGPAAYTGCVKPAAVPLSLPAMRLQVTSSAL